MIYEMELKHAGFSTDPGGVLVWNSETGELSRYGAQDVKEYAEYIIQKGIVIDDRFGTSSTENPLKDEMAMAIMLSNMTYKIPKELLKFVKRENTSPAKYPSVN